MEMLKGVQERIGALNNSSKDMSRDEACKYICCIEEKKMGAQVKMQMAVASNAFPREAIEHMMECEKTKAYDELFNEYGVEEEHLNKAGVDHDLSMDMEFKAMLEHLAAQFQQKIQKQAEAQQREVFERQ